MIVFQFPVANCIVMNCLKSTSWPGTSSISNLERKFAATIRISAQAKLLGVSGFLDKDILSQDGAIDLLDANARVLSPREGIVSCHAVSLSTSEVNSD